MEQKEELLLYKAYGLVKIKIYSYTDGDTNEESKKYFGILDVSEQKSAENLESDKIAIKIRPRIERSLEKKISFSQLVNSGKPLICGVYPKTTEDFKLKRLRIQNVYSDESKPLSILNLFIIRGEVDYFDIEKQLVIIKIVPQSMHLKEFDMAVKCRDIKYELKNLELGQFWEINAELVNNEFRLQSASMIKKKNENDTTDIIYHTPTLKSKLVDKAFDKTDDNNSLVVNQQAPFSVETELNNAASTKTKKKKKSKTGDIANQEAPATESQLINVAENKNTAPLTAETQLVNTVTEQTVTQGTNSHMQVRSEVTIKISGSLPSSAPTAHKKVQIEITDQNGINFTAILNPKSWKKAEASVAQFSDWSGMISGKLGKTEQGLEIIDAGIQIFERKPKELKEVKEETKQEES